MPPNILTVFRRSDSRKQLIAKKVREESNELEILKLLNNFQPKSEHIISLLDSFQVQSRTWAIVPKMDSVMDYISTAPHRFSENIGQICWGLIKGLAYLHGHCIAHRDIKPDNLLVREDFCLKVIDFDLAIKVRDEDDEVDGQCGTEGWMAPEVEARLSMYSPIKADRWSCGQVIMYLLDEFGKKDEPLTGIAMKLKVHSPRQRPSLLEWQISSALPVLDGAKGRRAGERKALRPRQDPIKVDEGESLIAKKRRLAMSGEDEPLAQYSQAAWPPRPCVDGDGGDEYLSDLTDLSTEETPVPRKRKGKSGEVLGPTRQSTRLRKPSAHFRRIATGEGTTSGVASRLCRAQRG
jgi:serine/threonine protein kinase